MKPKRLILPKLDLAAIDALAAGRRFTSDSRKVQPGDVFLAFQGEYADGRTYIDAAIVAGASAVIWEAEDFKWNPVWTVPNLAVPQLRAQAGIVASHLLGDPSQALFVVGVTGTNGKTSIANWLGQAFTQLGHKAGVLGTLGNGLYGALEESTHTTLDPLALQGWLAQFRDEGASHVAMEVSSHGLAQDRANGATFNVAIFTNLTRDHLDYHGDMDSYGAAKAKLFDWEGLQVAVINADDAFGQTLIGKTTAPRVLSYGITGGDVRALRIANDLAGLKLDVATPLGEITIRSKLVGQFNAYNLLACLATLIAADVPLAAAVAALEQIESAPGRMQRIGGEGKPVVVVDYAHTPDALEKVLLTLKAAMPQGTRLYCVFGCGGDRDPGKRPIMGEIACRLADSVVITSDNPRSENPRDIILDIVKGVRGVPGTGTDNYTIESDRRDAIADAIALAGPNDVVLIAGKGHEKYQEVAGVRHHFDDVEQAQKALQRKKA
ncbi:UDP-N-acetylmuramoyl-L-alanyl-D-glutamate--2,6-diaminopimelate ligase [Andreprevotia chitinilytica]|uniref:UDP-N-acetylmuramoyl-L-alanyl-D-glutamate--2, 6-diaminopimelate ligase n=1 Tax=Andreprevotia chitinilytica TaxID=396808 RepID=UPI000553712B|nr:UDP-N-acetylmuramoyl-L-alanyl-D-glutamate--2,6-diaminopimelate ligase [Andreprevotia chitinilytica]